MTRLIDAEALSRAMYEEAFEKDSDMQRWDSGCWIRYKLFENVLDRIPSVVRCKECKYWRKSKTNEGVRYCERFIETKDQSILYESKPDDYCSKGEKR